MSLFQTKSIESLQKEAAADVGRRRSLSRTNLVSLGIAIYFGYSRHHSKLNKSGRQREPTAD